MASLKRPNLELSKQLAVYLKDYRPAVQKILSTRIVGEPIFFAVISRESAWGLTLTPPLPSGTGDFRPRPRLSTHRTAPLPPDSKGFGRGLGQIDFDAHEFARIGDWQDPVANLTYAADYLHTNFQYLAKLFPKTPYRTLWAYTIGSYNAGLGRAKSCLKDKLSIDLFTTGEDYAIDVIERAGWFQGADK